MLSFEEWFAEQPLETRELLEAHTRGLRSALQKERDARTEAERRLRGLDEAVTKREDGKDFPAGDYAYVPDPQKPSTWKLRLTSTPGGKPDARIVGAAAAALGPGFRGQKVQIPADDLAAVKRKVRSAWRKANPDKGADEMPGGIKEAASLEEAANVAEWLESRIHAAFTNIADDLFGNGYVTREERIAMSGAIGDALDAFHQAMTDNAPALFKRGRWTVAPDAPEGAEVIESGIVPLVERAVRDDGTIPVKIIQPGWGSSGFYSPELLERDGPRVFKKGLKMFWDHPTITEEAERPERSLRDLAAELVADARWVEAGPGGPGLYADAKVFEAFGPAIDELAPHIGVSIRALGKAEPGEAEDREGRIVTEIVSAHSVDFVTTPGAGGRVLELFESARRRAATTEPEVNAVNEEEVKALQEAKDQAEEDLAAANAELQRMREASLLREAQDFVSQALEKVEMPAMTRTRLRENLAAQAPVTDGQLDQEAFSTIIDEAVKAELEYLAKVLGTGAIKGMGSAGSEDEGANLHEGYKAYYIRQGKGADEAEKLAALAVQGH